MIINKRGLKLLLLSVFFSGIQVAAQDDGNTGRATTDIPGTTAVSRGAPATSPDENTDEQGSPSDLTDTSTPGRTGQPVKPAVVTGVTALSQDYEERKSATIRSTTHPPVIDGVLQPGEWDGATVISDMHQFLPIDHGEPSERSKFYLMYDADYLYIGARLWDDHPELINARQLIQGQGMPFDDAFEFILDPFNNQRSGYNFQINPNGIRRDGIYENTNSLNRDWDGIWDAAARIDDKGWTAEVAIPFKTLNFDSKNPDWGFSIARTIARKKEELAWSSYNRALNPSTAGVLRGFNNIRQGMGLDVVPSISIGGNRDFIRSDTDRVFEPSLDVSYNITPSLTGVLTFNTDFSATEVDNRQVNLNRFALFFPEKRDFFLQDADIFTFGGLDQNGIPFFSRKIGLSALGNPVDLNAGIKLTGRIGRWNVGTLAVRQGAYDNVNASMLMVGRVSANVLDESTVGAIMTYGDPLSNKDNMVIGADFNYRNTHFMQSHSLTGHAWFQHSDTPGISNSDQAWGANINVTASEGVGGSFTYERFGNNFNPALGFINRIGIQRFQINVANRYRPANSWLRSIFSFISIERIENLNGDVETQAIRAAPIQLDDNYGDHVNLLLFHGREVLTQPFEINPGVVIQPGDYTFNRIGSEWVFAPERVIAPRFAIFAGQFYNGKRLNLRGGFDWRPNKHFFIGMDYNFNDVDLPAGHFETRLMSISGNWAINAKWSFVNLIQYDNFSNTVGINSRLHWNPHAGEDMYVVLNYTLDSPGMFRDLTSNKAEILLKYTRTLRF